MKKAIKNNLKTIIVAVIASVVTSVTSIFAYTLIAENVGFTPHDNTWDVQDVDAALNNLNTRTNQLDTHFSTEEQVVGRWVDGKKIYQKSIPYSGSGGTSVTIATLSNIDTMITIEGYVVESGIMYNLNNFNCRLRYNISNSTLYWEGRVNWSPLSGYATIQYTKVTE